MGFRVRTELARMLRVRGMAVCGGSRVYQKTEHCCAFGVRGSKEKEDVRFWAKQNS